MPMSPKQARRLEAKRRRRSRRDMRRFMAGVTDAAARGAAQYVTAFAPVTDEWARIFYAALVPVAQEFAKITEQAAQDMQRLGIASPMSMSWEVTHEVAPQGLHEWPALRNGDTISWQETREFE